MVEIQKSLRVKEIANVIKHTYTIKLDQIRIAELFYSLKWLNQISVTVK